MKSSKGITSMIFHCLECKKVWEDQKTSKTNARNHATQTGHKVIGEVCYAYRFN